MKQDVLNNSININFYICASNLDFTDIDILLNVKERKTRSKESFPFEGFAKDYWSIETGYQQSNDLNVQIDQIVLILANKIETINKICKKYNAVCGFCIIIKCENRKRILPAIYLEKEFISLAAQLNAKVNFDFV